MDKFIQWSQLIMCDKIKPNEKVVLMVILNCNNMAWSYIAHSEIMRQSGLSERTVQRTLAKLKKMGLSLRKLGEKYPQKFSLLFDKIAHFHEIKWG